MAIDKASLLQNPVIGRYKGKTRNVGSISCLNRGKTSDLPKRLTFMPTIDIGFRKFDTHLRKNKSGYQLAVGSMHLAHDGKRTILEVGCSTVIFFKPHGGGLSTLYIQSHEGFLHDVTLRLWGKFTKARINRDAKMWYKRWKLSAWYGINLYAGTSWSAFFKVFGVNSVLTVDKLMVSYTAIAELNNAIIKEMKALKAHSPLLHKKITELLSSEKDNFPIRTLKSIPTAVDESSEAQAAYAGAFSAKVWNLITKGRISLKDVAILTAQIPLLKGMSYLSNSPKAISKVIDTRYQPVIDSLSAEKLKTPEGIKAAKQKVNEFFKSAGVTISKEEEDKILKEVTANSKKLSKSLLILSSAINNFKKNSVYSVLP